MDCWPDWAAEMRMRSAAGWRMERMCGSCPVSASWAECKLLRRRGTEPVKWRRRSWPDSAEAEWKRPLCWLPFDGHTCPGETTGAGQRSRPIRWKWPSNATLQRRSEWIRRGICRRTMRQRRPGSIRGPGVHAVCAGGAQSVPKRRLSPIWSNSRLQRPKRSSSTLWVHPGSGWYGHGVCVQASAS